MTKWSIFFDDGGVMSDNIIKGNQWQKLVPQFFIPKYGGNEKDWAKANFEFVIIVMDKVEELIKMEQNMSYNDFKEYENTICIEHMFKRVGIPFPPKHEYSQICRALEEWVTPQVNSAIPGIIKAIETLKLKGYTLHTASGEASWQLKGYLTNMGVLDYFTNLYGPDLINIMKGGLQYYERIFLHAEVDPENAIIIDDKQKLLNLAMELGAHTIQSCVLNPCDGNEKYHYRNPNNLMSLIAKIAPV
ncbi:MAG: HAD family hydrolase [Candidatus Hodarchaeales archaeon]|jgi:FMN phosphatase YigB (HAD superfamily)